eukprot:TRINITY_DN10932_c0_g1_i1.p1 TRINITY_DN10932_c0_g1~~TRINITY_DN10932_c0_g1_i1.p1  ORF type:complete len:428 (-),score=92.37 TRINITY_DN10932_c0_g1_i1:25-1308(-)
MEMKMEVEKGSGDGHEETTTMMTTTLVPTTSLCFDSLPYEIRLYIFGFLRLKQRMRLTRVSSRWREVLLDDNECKRIMMTKFIGKDMPEDAPTGGWGVELLKTKRKLSNMKRSLGISSEFHRSTHLFRWAASNGFVAMMEKHANRLVRSHLPLKAPRNSDVHARTVWRRVLVIGSGGSNVDAFKSAILRRHRNAVQWMLSHVPSSILVSDRSTLTLAIKMGDAAICSLMLQAGFPLDECNDLGIRPLHAAALLGKAEVVKCMLEFMKWNPLDPQSTISDELLEILEREDDDRRTALWLAASEGHYDVVELLLSTGADPLAKDFDKRTPIDIALAEGHSKVAELLKRYVENPIQRTLSVSSTSSMASNNNNNTRKKNKKNSNKRLYDEEDDDDYEDDELNKTPQKRSAVNTESSSHSYITRSTRSNVR